MDSKTKTEKGVGRPTKFKASYVESARTILEGGATLQELSDILEVSLRTLRRWAARHPEFRHVLKVGREFADDCVEMSLFQKARGYTVVEVHRTYRVVPGDNGEDVKELTQEKKIEKHYAPDVTAGIFWLKNRRSAQWRDRHEYTGADGGPIEYTDLSDMEIARRVVAMLEKATNGSVVQH